MKSPLAFSAVKIREKGELHVEEQVPASAFPDCLEGEGLLRGPISVSLVLSYVGAEYLARGTVSGQWELECCRCLAPTQSGFEADLSAALPESEGLVDAAEEVRQSLILAIPAMRYCRVDCKGLCAQCGANKNLKDCGCRPPAPQGFKVTRKEEHHA